MGARKQGKVAEVKYETRGKGIQATINWNGQRLRPSFSSMEEAKAWGDEQTIRMIRGQEIEAPAGAKTFATTGVPTTMGELYEHTKRVHWLVNGPNGGPQKAWPKTEIAANQAVEAVGRHTRLSKLTVPFVENALRAFEEKRENTPRTTNRRIAALSVMFKEAVRLDAMVKVLPLRKAPEIKDGRTFRITPAIEEAMLTWALGNGRVDFYDFLVLSLYLGQRENETLRLRRTESFAHPRDGYMDGDDFAMFPRGEVRNKSKVMRAVPTRLIVAEVINRHRAQGRGADARILDGMTKDKVTYAFAQMRADLLAANLPDIVAQKRDGLPVGKDFVIHVMRNEFCSRLGDDGFTIAEFSGHTDLKTCARYVKPNKTAHRMRMLREGKITPGLPGGDVPAYAPTQPLVTKRGHLSVVASNPAPAPGTITPDMAVKLVQAMKAAGLSDMLKALLADDEPKEA